MGLPSNEISHNHKLSMNFEASPDRFIRLGDLAGDNFADYGMQMCILL